MKRWFVRIALGVVGAALLAGDAGVARPDGGALPPPQLAPPPVPVNRGHVIDIQISNNVFTPDFVIINLGDTVRWTWSEGFHSTTSYDGLWDSTVLTTGATFEYTFGESGQYDYFCTPHIDCCNMMGTIYVVGG